MDGGARDVLLLFAIVATAHIRLLDTVLFFRDLSGAVQEWSLPRLTATAQETTKQALQTIINAEDAI